MRFQDDASVALFLERVPLATEAYWQALTLVEEPHCSASPRGSRFARGTNG